MNNIRFVPTSAHGVFDYVGGVGLIASPFIFGFFMMGGIAVALPIPEVSAVSPNRSVLHQAVAKEDLLTGGNIRTGEQGLSPLVQGPSRVPGAS